MGGMEGKKLGISMDDLSRTRLVVFERNGGLLRQKAVNGCLKPQDQVLFDKTLDIPRARLR